MDDTKTEKLGSEVTPDRDSSGTAAPKRARRRLEPSGSDEANYTHDWGRHEEGVWPEENKAQLLSESVIELLHVCTLIQVAMNNTPADDQGIKHDSAATHQLTDENCSTGRRIVNDKNASLK